MLLLRLFLIIKKINSEYCENNIAFGLGYFDGLTAVRLSTTKWYLCVL